MQQLGDQVLACSQGKSLKDQRERPHEFVEGTSIMLEAPERNAFQAYLL